MNNKKRRIIGFWGYPSLDLINKYKSIYPNHEWIDLDIDYGCPKLGILPDAYCKIVKNMIYNAIWLKDRIDIIIAPIGKEKCDSGWFAAKLLKDMGFKVEESIYEQLTRRNKISISTSNLPLRKKFELITADIIEQKHPHYEQSKPEFGFWGVPPNDLSVLELFPDNTHVYGWTRCVEAGVPGDIELEMFVDKDVPTVFYTQAFCAKAQLAKYLADKYNGLYVDIDDMVTNSVKYKIEAFIKLR